VTREARLKTEWVLVGSVWAEGKEFRGFREISEISDTP
jgi:hypothetical protein